MKDGELVMSEMPSWGVTDFLLERISPEEHLNLNNLLAKKATVAASPKILQLEL